MPVLVLVKVEVPWLLVDDVEARLVGLLNEVEETDKEVVVVFEVDNFVDELETDVEVAVAFVDVVVDREELVPRQ